MQAIVKKAVKTLLILLIFISLSEKNYAQSTATVTLTSTTVASWSIPQGTIASI
jgi:hypothetical protein